MSYPNGSNNVGYYPAMPSGAPHEQNLITAHQKLDLEEIALRQAKSPWGDLDELRRECDILPGEVLFSWVHSDNWQREKMVSVFSSLNGLQRIPGMRGEHNLDSLRNELLSIYGDDTEASSVLDAIIAFNLRYQGVAMVTRNWNEEKRRESPAAAMKVMGPAEIVVSAFCTIGQFLTISVDSKRTPWGKRTDGQRAYIQGIQTSKRLVSIVPYNPRSIAAEFASINTLYLASPKLMAVIKSPTIPSNATQYAPLECTHQMLVFAGINFATMLESVATLFGGIVVAERNQVTAPYEEAGLRLRALETAVRAIRVADRPRYIVGMRLALYAAFGLVPRKPLPRNLVDVGFVTAFNNLFTDAAQESLMALRSAFLRTTMYSVAPKDHHVYVCLNTWLRGHDITTGQKQTGRGFVADSSSLEGQALMMQRRITGEFLGALVDQAMRQRTQVIGRMVETSQAPLVHALIS